MSRFQEYFKTPNPLHPQLFTPPSCQQDQAYNLFADQELHVLKSVDARLPDQNIRPTFTPLVIKKTPVAPVPTQENCYLIHEKIKFGDDSEEQIRTPKKKHERNAMLQTTANKKYELRPSGNNVPHAIDSKEAERTLRVLTSQAYSVVCEKGATTYKLVSQQIINNTSDTPTMKEQKNIKRRVYDALNVLIALGKLEKKGRKIMPKKDFEKEKMLRQKFLQVKKLVSEKQKILKAKKQFCKSVIRKNTCLKKLIERNSTTSISEQPSKCISMPFFILNLQSLQEIKKKQDELKIIMNNNEEKTFYGDLNVLPLLKLKGK